MGNVEEHIGGEFFSAVLWDLRQDYPVDGVEIDNIVLGAAARVDDNPTFLEYRDAMLAENNSTYNGQYTCEVKRAFSERGIGNPGYRVAIDGPTGVNPDLTVTWEADAFCGNPSYSYKWYKGPSPSSLAFTGVTSSTYTESGFYGEDDFYLKVEVTDQDSRMTSDLHSVFVNEDGCGTQIICTNSTAEALPEAFALEDAYPNPVQAGAQAQLRFALPETAQVQIMLYDVLGREVERLVDRRMPPGFHRAPVEASALSSGVYLYRMRTDTGFTATGKMVVVK